MKLLIMLATVAVVAAQDKTEPGLIQGVVRSEAGGSPLAGVDVRVGRIETKTDSSGRYTVRGIPPGRHQVSVGSRARSSIAFGSKSVTVGPGQPVRVDFFPPLKATISGKVFDHHDEPVPGVEVALIAREFGAGAVRHYRRGATRTDDEGQYRLQAIQPGIPYFLLFRKASNSKLDSISDAPIEPKLRRPAIVPTYYPGAADPAGATAIVLRGGEHRQEINVRLLQAESYCIEGLLTAAGRPAAMTFQIHEAHVSFGLGPSGGVTGLPPTGESAPDGRIRICDLHPGDYRLTAFTGNINHPELIATTPVSIRDRDVRNLRLQPVPRLRLPVELAWADPPPGKPNGVTLSVSLMSMTRSFGGFASSARAAPPAQLEITDNAPSGPGLLMDDYYVRIIGLTGQLYVKEIVYGAESLMHAPLRVGSAPAGTTLRVMVGHDGGMMHTRVIDGDGKPVPDATVVVFPTSAVSDAELGSQLVTGQADQHGIYVSRALMPRNYLVFATLSPVAVLNPEFLAGVRAVRSDAQEIAVAPNASVNLKLALTELK